MVIRPAAIGDIDALTDLALRSKAWWGYDETFIEKCRDELTVTSQRIAAEDMRVAEVDGAIVGFISVMDGSLEDLFVEPAHIGAGTGSALFEVAKTITRGDGHRTLRIEADPHAAAWYRSKGAVDIGEIPSGSIPGRMLPLLELRL